MKRTSFVASVVISIFLLFTGQQTLVAAADTFTGWLSLLLSSTEKVTRMILAKDGGEINLPSGVSITIPPDALDKDTLISLEAVDVEKYEENVTAIGGVNGLHIVGGVFGPNGTQFSQPAIVRFPLPPDYEINTELVLFLSNGGDPLGVIPTTENISISGSPGSYVAEIELWHFTVVVVSNNCHAGTYHQVKADFVLKGCSEEQIAEQINKKYGISINPEDAKGMSKESIQAFLGTYFEDYTSPYNADEDIPPATIATLTAKALAGQKVVLAFNHKVDTWPPKEGSNSFYNSLPHTAVLEVVEVPQPGGSISREVMVRHTIVPPRNSMGPTLNLLREKIGVDILGLSPDSPPEVFKKVPIFYRDPIANINTFRKTKNGIAFKKYVQDRWGTTDFPDSVFPGPFPDSYNAVHIYLDKRTDPSLDPCYEPPCAAKGLPGPEVVSWGGYQWQRCDDGIVYNFDESVTYCENSVVGGYTDWRLPTVTELMDLVVCTNGCPTPLKLSSAPTYCGDGYSNDYARPTIDDSFQCEVSAYGTSGAAYPDLRYTIWFGDGGAVKEHRESKSYVRCVRD